MNSYAIAALTLASLLAVTAVGAPVDASDYGITLSTRPPVYLGLLPITMQKRIPVTGPLLSVVHVGSVLDVRAVYLWVTHGYVAGILEVIPTHPAGANEGRAGWYFFARAHPLHHPYTVISLAGGPRDDGETIPSVTLRLHIALHGARGGVTGRYADSSGSRGTVAGTITVSDESAMAALLRPGPNGTMVFSPQGVSPAAMQAAATATPRGVYIGTAIAPLPDMEGPLHVFLTGYETAGLLVVGLPNNLEWGDLLLPQSGTFTEKGNEQICCHYFLVKTSGKVAHGRLAGTWDIVHYVEMVEVSGASKEKKVHAHGSFTAIR